MKINNSQRKCLALLATLIALITFLHNPSDGYSTGNGYSTKDWVKTGSCTETEYKEIEQATEELNSGQLKDSNGANKFMDTLFKRNKLTSKCFELQDNYHFIEKDFLEWKSEGAVLLWMASISHTLFSLTLAITIGCIWFAVLSTKNKQVTESEKAVS